MNLQLNVDGLLTIVGLNSSLRSIKLDRNRVIGVSMGRSRIIDEFGVILFSNFFHDATKSKQNTHKWVYGFCNDAVVNLYNIGGQKKKKKNLLQFPQTSLTRWQVLRKNGRSHCFGISDIIRGL